MKLAGFHDRRAGQPKKAALSHKSRKRGFRGERGGTLIKLGKVYHIIFISVYGGENKVRLIYQYSIHSHVHNSKPSSVAINT